METKQDYPYLITNIHFASLENLKKHIGSVHGLSLLLLALAEPANKNIKLEVLCSSQFQAEDLNAQLISMVPFAKNIKIQVRSVAIDGKLQTKYLDLSGLSLDLEEFPDIYYNSGVVVDISSKLGEICWKLHKIPENTPRMLTFKLG